MNICVAGKNNIAIEALKYLMSLYPKGTFYAIFNKTDNGIDGFQFSYKKFVIESQAIRIVRLEDLYIIPDLIFISLEFDTIVKPHLFASKYLYNIHFSKLPQYKGMYTSALPILNGEHYSGVTLHCIDSGIDTGEIIDQIVFKLRKKETAESLYLKYISMGIILFKRNIRCLINHKIKKIRQPKENSTYYSRRAIDYSDIKINLFQTAQQIDRQIRAFYFPFFQVAHVNSIPIISTKITNTKSKEAPGSILEETDKIIRVATIDYDIILMKK